MLGSPPLPLAAARPLRRMLMLESNSYVHMEEMQTVFTEFSLSRLTAATLAHVTPNECAALC